MRQDFFDPDTVHDRASFLQFAEWLQEDRHEAEANERSDTERDKWGGSKGWQNSSIAGFLESAIAGGAVDGLG